ncbi:hypothetical protein E2562_027545, partial [Oryza meyeriana var. granulata]
RPRLPNGSEFSFDGTKGYPRKEDISVSLIAFLVFFSVTLASGYGVALCCLDAHVSPAAALRAAAWSRPTAYGTVRCAWSPTASRMRPAFTRLERHPVASPPTSHPAPSSPCRHLSSIPVACSDRARRVVMRPCYADDVDEVCNGVANGAIRLEAEKVLAADVEAAEKSSAGRPR